MSAIEGALGQDPAFVQLVARQGAGVALPAPARVLLLEEVTSANERGEEEGRRGASLGARLQLT